MERRLSAIMIADMVGYSRLMELDEIGTIQRQLDHRDNLIDPAFKRYNGKIIKTTGDGLLAEFPSVVEAVNCALSIQREMVEGNSGQTEDRRITYRVGINLGDVVHQDGDLFGDGVNVAARLEQMAEPGGICISGTAFDQLRATVEAGYENLGEVQVKNISRPIRAYRVLLDPALAGTLIADPNKHEAGSLVQIAGVALVLLALAAGGYWWSQRPEITPADPAKYAFDLPEQPSIAVLAFDNLSGDPANDYIGDGLSENIIATLSSFPKLFVIARNSSFHYKGTATPVQTIAEELGIRYILEGSIQSTGEKIRVTAQLIDTLDGRHLWANTYDRELSMDNLFALQDEITKDIAISLDSELISGDIARSLFTDAGDFQTYILSRQTIEEFQKFTPQGNQRTEELATQALERNPNSVIALIHLGYASLYSIPMGQSQDPAASMAAAWEYANRALSIDPDYPGTLGLVTWLYLAIQDHEAALKTAERMVQLSPGGGIAASLAGWAYSASGYPERGVELLKFGMRTEPYFPDWIPGRLAVSLMMLGRFDEAKVLHELLAERARGQTRFWALYGLAAIAVWQDDLNAARNYVATAVRLSGVTSSIVETRRWNSQIKDVQYLERFLDALRTAGVPEHPSAKPAASE